MTKRIALVAYLAGGAVAATTVLLLCLGLGLRPSLDTALEVAGFAYYLAWVVAVVVAVVAVVARGVS